MGPLPGWRQHVMHWSVLADRVGRACQTACMASVASFAFSLSIAKKIFGQAEESRRFSHVKFDAKK
jgi:hypothetical protein